MPGAGCIRDRRRPLISGPDGKLGAVATAQNRFGNHLRTSSAIRVVSRGRSTFLSYGTAPVSPNVRAVVENHSSDVGCSRGPAGGTPRVVITHGQACSSTIGLRLACATVVAAELARAGGELSHLVGDRASEWPDRSRRASGPSRRGGVTTRRRERGRGQSRSEASSRPCHPSAERLVEQRACRVGCRV